MFWPQRWQQFTRSKNSDAHPLLDVTVGDDLVDDDTDSARGDVVDDGDSTVVMCKCDAERDLEMTPRWYLCGISLCWAPLASISTISPTRKLVRYIES